MLIRIAMHSIIVVYLGLVTGCVTPSIQATRSIQLGDLNNNRHNYREATIHYENYLEASVQLGVYRNTETEADVRRKVAHAYSALNQFEKSVTHLEKALELDSTFNGNVLSMIEDYRLMGLQEAYQGRYKGRTNLP